LRTARATMARTNHSIIWGPYRSQWTFPWKAALDQHQECGCTLQSIA
ncbi:hypothetical protein T03_999, partial [Trichinella britovi]